MDLKVLHHVPHYKMNIFFSLNAAFRAGFTTNSLCNEIDEKHFIEALERCFANLNISLQKQETISDIAQNQYLYENCLDDLYTIGVVTGQKKTLYEKQDRSFLFRILRKTKNTTLQLIKMLFKYLPRRSVRK